MSLQTSGQISLLDIQNEFGGSNPIGIDEYYGANGYSPSSGTISLANFYGKTGFNYYSYIFGEQYGNSYIFSSETYTGPQIWSRNGIGENLTFYVQCVPAYRAVVNFYGTSILRYYYDGSLVVTFSSSGGTQYAAYWLFSPSNSGRDNIFESTIYAPRDSNPLGNCSITWDTSNYAPSYRTLYYHSFDFYTA